MFNTRKIGFGLAVAFGLMVTVPVMADEACDRALADIGKATTVLNNMQALRDQINQRQKDLNSGSADTAEVPLKCPACGMMMPMHATATMTRAVKYNGKTYYCCKGCDMSATADK